MINHHDPNLVLETILSNITDLVKTRHAFIDILDPANDMMVNKVAVGNFISNLGFRTKRKEGITGQAWERNDVVVIPDYSQWEGRLPEFRWVKSIAALPMRVKEQVVGVIGVAFDEPEREFTLDDIDLLQRYVNLASITLDNARLFSDALRQAQELSLLYQVRTAIARELDLTRIVKRTVEAITETFGYTLVSLYLLENDTLILQHQVGYDKVISAIPINQGVLGRVVRTGKPVLLEDAHSDPSFLGALEGIVSEVAVPIFDKERVVGTLNIESKNDIKLTKADLNLTLALSDQISIAISRAKLYETLQQNNEQLSTLHQITFNLLEKHNIDELLQTIVDHASRFLNAPYCEIMLLENEELVVKAFTQNQPDLAGDRAGRDEAVLSWKAFDTQLPATVDDYSIWPKRRSLYDNMDMGPVIVLPILLDHKSIGVLDVSRTKTGNPFDNSEIQAALLFSQLAALALDNAQLHETLRQESIRDTLTGLFNRRFMQETLTKEISQAERKSLPMTVVMFDLDHLKEINDTYGHSAGDEALRNLSLLLKTKVRTGDTACRYGGDEFTLILSDTKPDIAKQRMDELRMELKAKANTTRGAIDKTVDHICRYSRISAARLNRAGTYQSR